MRRLLQFSTLLLAGSAFGAETPALTAIRAGRLLDVAAERVRENVVVVVEGDRIREVGTSVPAGATLIDLGGQTLMPGLIDVHTHVLLQGDATAADYDAQLLGESLPYRTLRATRA